MPCVTFYDHQSSSESIPGPYGVGTTIVGPVCLAQLDIFHLLDYRLYTNASPWAVGRREPLVAGGGVERRIVGRRGRGACGGV